MTELPTSEPMMARAAAAVAESRRVCALTGAGISTDSGIPDYRGPNGLWTRDPQAARTVTLADYLTDPRVRVRAWQGRLAHGAWTARPNDGHRALVDLERRGLLHAVVTQNVDGLHQEAGHDPDRVIEVHGTIWQVECLSCDWRGPMAPTLDRVRAGEVDPPCLDCGGLLKSATVSFGQILDPTVWAAAVGAVATGDLLLVVGSSLQVQPVASLCALAVRSGARLVIVNAEPTPYDDRADAVVRGRISDVLPALVAAVSPR